MMTVSVCNEDKKERESLGLMVHHSYGLLGAVTVTKKDGKKVRLIQLRNPWGSHEWNGDWSDKSKLWTKELRD